MQEKQKQVKDEKKQKSKYLSESLEGAVVVLCAAVFLRLGVGMRHSMEKATQLVQGTPRLAASQRTYNGHDVSIHVRSKTQIRGLAIGWEALFDRGRRTLRAWQVYKDGVVSLGFGREITR